MNDDGISGVRGGLGSSPKQVYIQWNIITAAFERAYAGEAIEKLLLSKRETTRKNDKMIF